MIEYNAGKSFEAPDDTPNHYAPILDYMIETGMDRSKIGVVPIENGVPVLTSPAAGQETIATTETTAEQVTASGDVDLNGEVSIADAVLLARFLAEDAGINVSAEGKANADLDADGNLTGADQTLLLELIANVNA